MNIAFKNDCLRDKASARMVGFFILIASMFLGFFGLLIVPVFGIFFTIPLIILGLMFIVSPESEACRLMMGKSHKDSIL